MGNSSARFLAACHGRLKDVKYYFNRVDPGMKKGRAIAIVVRYGYLDILEFFIDNSDRFKDLSWDEWIYYALFEGCVPAIRLFTEKIPDYNWSSAVSYVHSERSPEVIRYLLTLPQVDPSYDNNRALKEAMRYAKEEIIQILLNDERVINSRNIGDILLTFPGSRRYHLFIDFIIRNPGRVNVSEISEEDKENILEWYRNEIDLSRISPSSGFVEDSKRLVHLETYEVLRRALNA